MAFHHVALATKDLAATHRFYTEAMGFRLVKIVAAPTPEGGWAKHAFYETGDPGDGMIAFWELHVEAIGADFPTDLNRSFGLPGWVNHLAFNAPTIDDLNARRVRWQQCGETVVEVDHEWCRSIYASDPNGITVEFCCTTRAFRPDEVAWAADNLANPAPELETAIPEAVFHEPIGAPGQVAAAAAPR
jgi:catechol 2,3-dioxygenase-like lactoylglutathione lyase family enzyme